MKAPFAKSTCTNLLSLALLLTALSARATTNTVILWVGNSTNYWPLFGTGVSGKIVQAAPACSAQFGLMDDGSVAENSYYYGVRLLPGLTNVVAIATSMLNIDATDNLALRSDGKVMEWRGCGPNLLVPPANLSNVVAIAPGMQHALALKTDGTVVGWGTPIYGNLNMPAGLTNIVAISAGSFHSLALARDGRVIAWGDDQYGESIVPAGLSNIVEIAAGYNTSTALRSDGSIVVWGNYAYWFSNLLAGVSNVATLGTGAGGVAVTTDGSLIAWGLASDYGGATFVPTPMVATNVVSLTCGRAVTAILGDGLPRTPAYPMTLNVPYGLPLILPAVSSATRALACQWQFNAADVPKATNSFFYLSTVDFTNAGIYSFAVSNWFGATTNFYNIKVVPFLVVIPPQDETVNEGTTAAFSVSAMGSGLQYQWQFNGVDLGGSTNSSLTLTNVRPEQAGKYCVVVGNSAGAATNAVTLTVLVRPDILVGGTNIVGFDALGRFRFAFRSQLNALYAVEYVDTLTDTNWIVLTNVAGSAFPVEVVDPAPAYPTRFYRVRKQ
jgi:hypothetical protein